VLSFVASALDLWHDAPVTDADRPTDPAAPDGGRGAGAGAPRTARARARAELTAEILRVAGEQLAAEGPAALSLRAVARELGMVSSAIYRYFPSRDQLLTALIIEAYDGVGAAAEAADGARPRRDHHGRFVAVGHAVRSWALAHPHRWMLLYGTPVTGYRAPEDTIGPATRVSVVLARILGDAHDAGALAPFEPPARPGIPRALRADLDALAGGLGTELPAEAMARGLLAWNALFGVIGFELGGQYVNVVADGDAWMDLVLRRLAAYLGLR
jgi:AcrR family transcriptional regulator